MIPPMDTAAIEDLAAQSAFPVESCQDDPRSLLIHTSLYPVPPPVYDVIYIL